MKKASRTTSFSRPSNRLASCCAFCRSIIAISLYANKVAPALATGNAVIVKAPTDDPLVCIVLTELLLESGVPKEVLQVVTGRGSTSGDWLVASDGVGRRQASPGARKWVGISWRSALLISIEI